MLRTCRAPALVLLLAAAACGGAQGQADPTPVPGNSELPPPGGGRLSQEDIAIRLTAGDLAIRFVPLEEGVIRLLATDGYHALHELRESRRTVIDSLAQRYGVAAPGLALVTFFGGRDGVQYQPQDMALSYQNQEFRAVTIIPISSNFTSQQLAVRAQASAIYLFETPIPVLEEFTLSYGAVRTDAWRGRLNTITRERNRLLQQVRPAVDTTRAP